MTGDPKDEIALESLFEAARTQEPALDESLVAKMMPPAAAAPPAASGVRWRDWWPAFGGLGMATALGVWIGIAVPVDTLLDLNLVEPGETLDVSAFYAGADPGLFLGDEVDL